MILFQINSTCNWGSTGKIAEEIGQLAIKNGWQSFIAYGRNSSSSQSNVIKVGDKLSLYRHGLESRLMDNHGLASRKATKELIHLIEQIQPNIIHLHNIHGYYLNYEILFHYLSKLHIPIVWTLHDCWAFTGHCSYFSFIKCEKWMTGCLKCPQRKMYPTSFFLDNSQENYRRKRNAFTSLPNLVLVPVSNWLGDIVKKSFLKKYHIQRIYNGVNLEIFTPRENARELKLRLGVTTKKIILGVANIWEKRKGLSDFYSLRERLSEEYIIVLVGLNKKQIESLPIGILGILRTNSLDELVDLYSAAEIFINPTWEDNFPTTNLEALACGTPIITYRTGGSIEAVNENTGYVVEPGDINGIVDAIYEIKERKKDYFAKACRERAIAYFNKIERYQEYLDLYESLLKK